MTPELKVLIKLISEWAGYVATLWSVLGPVVVLPALEFVRRFWRQYRGLLEAVRVFANRDRRILDLERRLSFALAGDEKRPGLLPVLRAEFQRRDTSAAALARLGELQAEFADIHQVADQLRDTAFRAPDMERTRAERTKAEHEKTGAKVFFDQGDLDARGLHVLTAQRNR